MKQVIRIIVLLWSLTLIVGKETAKTCIINEDCVLPCNSDYHDIIHWCNDKKAVHSFYEKRDQLNYQHADYTGRTFLFSDQIPNGNISLLLKQVRINDTGTYKCYTANQEKNYEKYIILNVKAPIKQVDIKVNNDVITCTTKKVYPQPNINWYIADNPINPSNIYLSEDTQGLFTLQSNLTSQPIQNNFMYSCTITLKDTSEAYTASLRPVPENVTIHSGDEASIDCPVPQNSNKKYTIKLTFNNFQIYNNQESQHQSFPDMWRDINVQLTPEGKLNLRNLDIAKHEGIYTCETTTAQSKGYFQTSLQIKPGQNTTLVITVVVVVVVVIIIFILAAVFLILAYKKKSKAYEENEQTQEQSIGLQGTQDSSDLSDH